MRRSNSGIAAVCLALAACAGIEPRVSVQTDVARDGREVTPTSTKAAPQADYTVVRGDTLYGIAFRNKLDFRDLAAWNNISAPYTIHPGQGLRLHPPSPTTRVAITPTRPLPASPAPSTPSTVPSVTVDRPTTAGPASVQSNAPASTDGTTQTFAMRDEGAPVEALKPTESQLQSAPIEVEQPAATAMPSARPVKETIGSPAAAIGLPATAPKPPQAVQSPPVTQAPPVVPTPPAEPVPASVPEALAVVDANAPVRERDGLRWRWPVPGRVVGRFVEGDPTQQGIDVGGQLGQLVLAAADGEVVYSGNGLIGYGELVIVQHSPGFLSAYGHNQKRLVNEGSTVKAGQPIAEMGRRGGIDMLHFEIRRNGKPVDPLDYLPKH